MTRKKQLRLCFWPMLGIIGMLLLFAIRNSASLQTIEKYLSRAADVFAAVIPVESVDMEGIGSAIGSILYDLADGIFVKLPVVIAVIMGFGLLLARGLYALQGAGVVLFRVQMVLLYLLAIAAAGVPLWIACTIGSFSMILQAVLFAVPVAAAILCSFVHTFRHFSAG
ncbi:MAG: hypothetical protein IKM30_02880 [Oscillospiraceae bacterium]|nr:hypothetical protein [Oscillospiraceae bacterium]